MTNATAKYILTAEDKTQNAINSAKRSFKELNDSARATGRGISTLTQLFVGAGIVSGIRQFTNAVVSAAAASDKDFASALKSVDTQMQKLLTPTSGLPAATAATKELAETLKNPELIAAADNLTSHVITAWAKLRNFAAEAVAGWNIIINGPSQKSLRIDDQILKLQRKRKDEESNAWMSGPEEARRRIAAIDAQIQALTDQYHKAIDEEGKATKASAAAEAERAAAIQRSNDYKAYAIRLTYEHARAMRELDESGKWLDEYSKKVDDATSAIIHFERAIEEGALDAIRDFNEELEKGVGKQADEWDKAQAKAKDSTDEMSEYAKRAAENIQDAFAEFLFDPFHAGLKGMLKGFVDTMRQMIAQKASAKILESSGIGAFFDTVLGSIFGGGKKPEGKAVGGSVYGGTSYLVGERGPELFTPGSSGNITPNHKLGGGGFVFSPTYNLSAPNGVDRQELYAVAQQMSAQSKADLLNAFDRAGLPRPSYA